jgi:hypothetical protein
MAAAAGTVANATVETTEEYPHCNELSPICVSTEFIIRVILTEPSSWVEPFFSPDTTSIEICGAVAASWW